jgi:lipoprotein-anchoring transpeptidase ErfK/SrfK
MRAVIRILTVLGIVAIPPALGGQRAAPPALLGHLAVTVEPVAAELPDFRDGADRAGWEAAREAAYGAAERRLVISTHQRRLLWMQGSDTLYVAPVAVGSGDTLSYRGQRWQFDTPRGRRVVQSKMEEPVWRPPLWHYVRFARENGYALREMAPGETIRLSDGSRLVIRNRQVGRVALDGTFTPIPQGEQIIFDETVFAPPFGTLNREVPGELGAYRLDLGNAYLIHGTPHRESIGTASTHGCIRVDDDDLEYLYQVIAVGTPVYIY